MEKENTLKIDEREITLKNFQGNLQIASASCLVHLVGENKIKHVVLLQTESLTFDLQDQSKLQLEDLWENLPNKFEVTIYSHNHTELDWSLAINLQNPLEMSIINNLCGNQNHNKLRIKVVNDTDFSCQIKTIGHIQKQTQENVFLEELKGLASKTTNITFLPQLIVDSDSVTANHNATIKCFDEEELFYLQCKGITKPEAKKLLKEGFINRKRKP